MNFVYETSADFSLD